MKKAKLFTAFLLLNIFALGIFAQTPDKKCVCPTLSVTGPSSVPQPGETITFIANVTGAGDGEVKYNWSVDKCTIIEGQGTPVITVDTTGLSDSTVTATVGITGDWCPVCESLTVSETIIGDPPPEARLLSKLRHPNCEEVLAQMDGFYIALQNNPSDTGYVISYGSSRAVRNVENIIINNTRLRRYDPNRIVLLSGGGKDKEATLELYLVPPGATPPVPNEPPAVSPDEEDVYENVTAETKPFIFSSEGYYIACPLSLDINGFAEALEKHPNSRGNIVIYESSQKLFREKEKEILNAITKQGIERKRLKTVFKKVKSNSVREGVELWFLP